MDLKIYELWPFQGHKEMFTEDILAPHVEGEVIKTDEQRINEVCVISTLIGIIVNKS